MPGVFVEETPFVVPAIAALPTGTALFVGQTAPPLAMGGEPYPLLRSLVDLERRHGTVAPSDPAAAMLTQAVRAYFASGGQALRLASVAKPDWAGIIAALRASTELTDVATVAAPGCWLLAGADPLAVAKALLAHVDVPDPRRFAIIDPPREADPSDIRTWRAQLDSRDAALYYPWVVAPDATGAPMPQPPSGFVAGAYATVDRTRGIFTSPANQVVPMATGLAFAVKPAMQDALNVAGINCIVEQPGRGIRIWGARTLSSDAQWRYVAVRRMVRWIANSIENGTAWVVFERNAIATWQRIRSAIETFLVTVWRDGGLMGSKPEEAYFVACDRSTMTQNDIDAGRLVCQVGVALVRPAEFVTFRITLRTSDQSGQ